MATASPPPNFSPSVSPSSNTTAPPPAPSTASPPPQSSPPPTTSPPPQPNASSPNTSIPSTPSPPPAVPVALPPVTPSTPPPQSPSTTPPPSPPPNADPPSPPISPPPSQSATPPVTPPPPVLPPNPSTSASPPPSQSSTPPATRPSPVPPSSPPTSAPPPPPSSNPPVNSPPPPPFVAPRSSPPPPPSIPAARSSPPPAIPPSPVPPSSPPTSATPPPSSNPPVNSPPPPPPSSNPPVNSTPPPPPSSNPPVNSPPPPHFVPPRSSPPPPPSIPAARSSPPPPPQNLLPPTPSPSNSTPVASPPAPVIRISPPTSPISPPSSTNNTVPNAPESSTGNGGIGTGGIVAIGAVVGIVMLSLIGFVVWCLKRRRKEVSGLNGVYVVPSSMGSSATSDSTVVKTQSSAPLIQSGSSSDVGPLPSEPGGLGNSRSWFAFEELVKATNGFSSQNLLGEGGFGSVYKGFLPDGRVVAVKQLKIGGGQGEREFKAEVEIISRIHHRHLVSLVGYCISESQRLLVYDYVPNNTLHFHLHGQVRHVLDWALRVKIAAGAARGIAYLHEDCHPRIIHRDIKSSNILLDDNYEAKVSDFGMAKLALDANTHITTRVIGTFGYVAPEYASSGKLTEKSDVFSYGVVVLELITGRKPVDASQPLGDESLVEWARPLLSYALENEDFVGLADPKLEKNYVESEMFRMIEVAAACVRHSAAKRPRMGQVVRVFDNLATADLNNGLRVGESELFNSAQQSEEIRLFRRMAFGSQNYSTEFFSSPGGLNSQEETVYNTGRG